MITHVNICSHDVQVAKRKPNAKCLGINGKYTVNPLHMNLQVVNFQRYIVHSDVKSQKLVHMSGVHGPLCVSSTSSNAFVYFTV